LPAVVLLSHVVSFVRLWFLPSSSSYSPFFPFFLYHYSHPLKLSQRLKDPLKRYNGREEVQSTSVFNSTNIVALIGIVLTVIVMMSMRLASIMSHEHPVLVEGDKATTNGEKSNSTLSSTGYEGVNCNSPSSTTPDEYSKLLV